MDRTGERVLKEGMPFILERFEQFGIKTTFFFTGYIANKFPDVVKMVLPYGHEVGCHGLSHKPEKAFDCLPLSEQTEHLHKAKDILEDVSQMPVISFRAPALRINRHTPVALARNQFTIDSSIASQRIDSMISFGGLRKLRWLAAPRLPYRTAPNDLFKKGDGPIIEIPVSALLIPYIGTTMRIAPFITKITRWGLHTESGFNQKPIVFNFHPNEVIDENDGNKRVIHRRTRHFLSYLVGDLLRSKLKIRNLGDPAKKLFEKEIRFFAAHRYRFVTLKDYCMEKGYLTF